MDDRAIRDRILTRLGEGRTDGRVEVDVRDGRVVLWGAVRTWSDRDEIERLTWTAPEVRAVDNCLTIRLAGREAPG